VIKHLVETYPVALKVPNKGGDLPLHIATNYCRGREDFERITGLLLGLHREGSRCINGNGQLPIHCSLDKDSEINCGVLDLLKEAYPECLYMADGDGYFPIHIACSNENFSLQVAEWFNENSPGSWNLVASDGCLPLHHAVRNKKCPIDAINDMIESFPPALEIPDRSGSLPLHYSVCNFHGGPPRAPNVEVFQRLLDAYPSAMRRADVDGGLPVHDACGNTLAEAAIDLMVRQDPECIGQFDNHGYLPFHRACIWQTSSEVLERLTKDYNPTLIKEHKRGATLPYTRDGVPPLFLATEENDSLDVIKFLVERSPELFHGNFHDSTFSASQVAARPPLRRSSRKRKRTTG
jgi:ankyrin repeat protein